MPEGLQHSITPPSNMGMANTSPFGLVAFVAALYFGRDILLPLAIAVLLTFALAPVVGWLCKQHIPRLIAIMTVVTSAFAAIFLFCVVVVVQLGSLAENLPRYQNNLETKVLSIKDAHFGEEMYGRISKLVERIGRGMEMPAQPEHTNGNVPHEVTTPPLPVEVVQPAMKPLQVIQTIIGPLIEPLATGGIIIVVVIFMLLKREDLRDRFIRLVGAGDLHRTTEALQDAGERVGRYLLMQLVVNVTYAIPVGIALWIIGVPNALLWGLLALVLRFVPYIGPILASIFPLALALAVDPGWTMVFWTAAIFIVLELVSNNVVEPWLYGSRTGLSSLAIIVAAIFWTWLWGPLGLILSTPLTVCLVVLGRHVTQFEFLDVLLGNEPVLAPHQQLYQRLLAGDPDEATIRAETFLQEDRLIAFYESVAIPALALGELDRASGEMGNLRRKRVADSALALVDNLEEYAEEEADEGEKPEEADKAKESDDQTISEEQAVSENRTPKAVELPSGEGKVVLCAGGRGELDNAAAAMLAQVLAAQGATARFVKYNALEAGGLAGLDLTNVHAVVIGFLNAASETQAKYIVRRLKRDRLMRIGVVLWTRPANAIEDIRLKATIGCDFIAHSLTQAVTSALQDEAPVRLKPAKRMLPKRIPQKRLVAEQK